MLVEAATLATPVVAVVAIVAMLAAAPAAPVTMIIIAVAAPLGFCFLEDLFGLDLGILDNLLRLVRELFGFLRQLLGLLGQLLSPDRRHLHRFLSLVCELLGFFGDLLSFVGNLFGFGLSLLDDLLCFFYSVFCFFAAHAQLPYRLQPCSLPESSISLQDALNGTHKSVRPRNDRGRPGHLIRRRYALISKITFSRQRKSDANSHKI